MDIKDRLDKALKENKKTITWLSLALTNNKKDNCLDSFKKSYSIKKIIKIAQILQINPAWLQYGTEQQHISKELIDAASVNEAKKNIRIKELIKDKNKGYIADMLYVSVSTVRFIFTEKINPTRHLVKRIANLFEVNPAWVQYGDGYALKPPQKEIEFIPAKEAIKINILDSHNKGVSKSKIAADLNVSISTVYRLLKEAKDDKKL